MNEIVEYLYNIPRFARTGGLEKTRERLKLLGSPETSFHYIHVAGTNGKGSVCAYMESCLREMGFKTGLFTSPHLVRINERMRINNEEISDEDFAEAFYKVKALVDVQITQGIPHPTFFEFIYLMAMCAFQKAGIEYGVIETGLGGRLDLTNAAESPDLTLITSIGLDHTAILGDTIEKIAEEKAGIIKAGVPLVYLADRPGAAGVIKARAEEVLGPEAFPETDKDFSGYRLCYPVLSDWVENISSAQGQIRFSLVCPYFEKYDIMLNTNGIYQAENAALAVTGMEILRKSMNRETAAVPRRPMQTAQRQPKAAQKSGDSRWRLPEDVFRKKMLRGLVSMVWPGRMESVGDNIYVDGAHNDDGIREMVRSVESTLAGKDIYLVFAVAEDKDYQQMVRHVCGMKHLKGVIVTEIDNGRRRDFHEVMKDFEKNWHGNIQGTYNVSEAIMTGKKWKGRDGVLICTGSLYLVGHVKELLGGI